MEIVDALNKLSFSFWQIVVVIAFIIFRKEIKEIVRRVSSVKVAGSEINWAQKSDTVSTLQNLKSTITSGESTHQDILDLIDSKIHNRLIFALTNIKQGTTYLWPALANTRPGESVTVPIRQQTLERISSDIDVLRSSGVLDYEIDIDKSDPRGVHMFTVKPASGELVNLIAEVEKAI